MSRLNHLGRVIPPEMLHTVAAIHDKQTKRTFCSLLGCKTLSNGQWQQVAWPIRYGGFGMTSLSSTSAFAFVSSWAHSLSQLPQCFPDTSLVVDRLISNKEDNTISHSLHQAIHPNYHLSSLTTEIKLQRKLTDSLLRSEVSDRIDSSTCPKEVSRLRSIQGRGGGHH